MCGIAAVFGSHDDQDLTAMELALDQLEQRGPDHRGLIALPHALLGHRRLSIIDTSERGHQPMQSQDGRYSLIFNGEIYNFRALRDELSDASVLHSNSDTEVLLQLLIEKGEDCIRKLNGFFAFAFYDNQEGKVIVARDRFGIKPLFYSRESGHLKLASSLNALMKLGVDKELDEEALAIYLHLNYVPAPYSMLKSVRKLMPGTYATYLLQDNQFKEHTYYRTESRPEQYKTDSYEDLQQQLRDLLHQSVKRRMVADVPLGGFLSGGVDSSVICHIAKKYDVNFKTFSIGYKGYEQYDESSYAQAVAEKLKTDHHAYMLEKDDLLAGAEAVLSGMDEPFADSSAIPLNLLSRNVTEHIKVALSGDGADEIFSGYNKHQAEYFIRTHKTSSQLLTAASAFTRKLPQSRESKWGNRFRQITRFGHGAKLSAAERYWNWAGYYPESDTGELLLKRSLSKKKQDYIKQLLNANLGTSDFNQLLLQDVNLVLANDMLVKVDTMSMAHSLEVRVPFLDHELVDFAFQLPVRYKINGKMRKRILQDAFRKDLPEQIYNRSKHGFEVPMLEWLRGAFREKIDAYLSEEFIRDQGVFNYSAIQLEKERLFSASPGEAHARIWGLLVFQSWWEQHLSE